MKKLTIFVLILALSSCAFSLTPAVMLALKIASKVDAQCVIDTVKELSQDAQAKLADYASKQDSNPLDLMPRIEEARLLKKGRRNQPEDDGEGRLLKGRRCRKEDDGDDRLLKRRRRVKNSRPATFEEAEGVKEVPTSQENGASEARRLKLNLNFKNLKEKLGKLKDRLKSNFPKFIDTVKTFIQEDAAKLLKCLKN